MSTVIRTARLELAPWTMADIDAALRVFGNEEVARWLPPTMDPVPDLTGMRQLVRTWLADGGAVEPPLGRWRITTLTTPHTVGAASLLPLPPGNIDCQISVQLVRDQWGNGYAGEAGHALAHYAFDAGTDEVFAVARPANQRAAAAARRMGMDWVGQTDKYYDTRLDVFRLRKYDLDVASASSASHRSLDAPVADQLGHVHYLSEES